jgi:hypothetical protein
MRQSIHRLLVREGVTGPAQGLTSAVVTKKLLSPYTAKYQTLRSDVKNASRGVEAKQLGAKIDGVWFWYLPQG